VENGLNVKKMAHHQRTNKRCIVSGSGETVKNKYLCKVPAIHCLASVIEHICKQNRREEPDSNTAEVPNIIFRILLAATLKKGKNL